MPRGPTCSTTAAGRRTRWDGSSFASPDMTTFGSIAQSDALCTALQLANFWQDLERDWMKGRLYVPRADVEAAGAKESDLDDAADHAGVAGGAGRGCRADAHALRRRPRAWPMECPADCGGSCGFTWLGGVRILDRLERDGFDVFHGRPALGPPDAPASCGARWPGRWAGPHRREPKPEPWHATPASTTPSWSCPRRNAARSSPSGISAVPWTMKWTRREMRSLSAVACSSPALEGRARRLLWRAAVSTPVS